MTDKQKIIKVEKLFNEIVELFPNSNLNIHGVDVEQTPEHWNIRRLDNSDVWVAENKDPIVNFAHITIFDKKT